MQQAPAPAATAVAVGRAAEQLGARPGALPAGGRPRAPEPRRAAAVRWSGAARAGAPARRSRRLGLAVQTTLSTSLQQSVSKRTGGEGCAARACAHLGSVVLLAVGFVAQDAIDLVDDGRRQLWKDLREMPLGVRIVPLAHAGGRTWLRRARRLHPGTLTLHSPARRLSDPVTGSLGRAHPLPSQPRKASGRAKPVIFVSSEVHNLLFLHGASQERALQHCSSEARAGRRCPVHTPPPRRAGSARSPGALPRRGALTCIAPIFSISWSALEAPSKTELTPSLRRHQAGAGGRAEPEHGPAAPASPSASPQPPYQWRAGAGCSPGARRWPAAPSASPAVAGPPRSGSCPSATGIPGEGRGLGRGLMVGLGGTGTLCSQGIPKLPGSQLLDLVTSLAPLPWLCPPRCDPPGRAHLQRGAGVGGDPPVVLPRDDAAGQRGPGHGSDAWGQSRAGVTLPPPAPPGTAAGPGDRRPARPGCGSAGMRGAPCKGAAGAGPPYLSCGRARGAAPPPSPAGTCGTRPARRSAGSG